jgi:hypothetical protein
MWSTPLQQRMTGLEQRREIIKKEGNTFLFSFPCSGASRGMALTAGWIGLFSGMVHGRM